jgi:ribonuclease T1
MSNMSSSPPPKPIVGKTPSWLIVVVMLAIVAFAWWQNNHAARSNAVIDNSGAVSLPDEDSPTLTEVVPENHVSSIADSKDSAGPDSKDDDPVGANKETSTAPKAPKSLRPSNLNLDQKASPNSPSDRGRLAGPLSGMRQKPSTASQPDNAKPEAPVGAEPSDKSDTLEKSEKTSHIIEKQTIRDLNGRIVYKGPIDLNPTLDRIERGEENRHRNDGTSFQNRENRLPRKPTGYYKEYVHPTKGESGPGPQRIIGKEGEVWYTPDHYKTFKKIK